MVSTLRELFLRRTKVGDGTPPIVWKEEAVTRQASVVVTLVGSRLRGGIVYCDRDLFVVFAE